MGKKWKIRGKKKFITSQRVRIRATKAGNVKLCSHKSRAQEFWVVIIWWKIGNSAAEIYSENLSKSELVIFENLFSLYQLEILRRKSTARIYCCHSKGIQAKFLWSSTVYAIASDRLFEPCSFAQLCRTVPEVICVASCTYLLSNFTGVLNR